MTVVLGPFELGKALLTDVSAGDRLDLRPAMGSKIIVYMPHMNQSVNKRILSCFFEKRSIVSRPAVWTVTPYFN